jgi:hypothetical protein
MGTFQQSPTLKASHDGLLGQGWNTRAQSEAGNTQVNDLFRATDFVPLVMKPTSRRLSSGQPNTEYTKVTTWRHRVRVITDLIGLFSCKVEL